MSTVTALASGNSSSNCTIVNASSAYTNTSSTTYANLEYANESGYARFSGFNFSSIPDGSIINSITFKVKSYTSMYVFSLYFTAYINGTSYATGTQGDSTTVTTLTNSGTPTTANLKASASNNYIHITTTGDVAGTRKIYGIEIIVDYSVGYTITASAGDNGSISPSGDVSVASGANQTFTVTPDSGYLLDVLTVDSSPTSPTTITPTITYVFSNVTTTHSISVTFKTAYDIKRFFHAQLNETLFGGE